MKLQTIRKIEEMAKKRGMTQREIEELFAKYEDNPKKIFAEIKKKGQTTETADLVEITGLLIGMSDKRLTNRIEIEKALRQGDKLYKVGPDNKIMRDDDGKAIEVKERYEYVGYVIVDGELLQIRCHKKPDVNIPSVCKIKYNEPKNGKKYTTIYARDIEETSETYDINDIFTKIEDLENAIADYAIYDLQFVKIKEVETKDKRVFKQALFVGKDSNGENLWVTSEPYDDISKDASLIAGKVKMKESNGRTFYTIYYPVEVQL